MDNNQNSNQKGFDLEDRTLTFSKKLLLLVRKLPKIPSNFSLGDQVLRSGTSVGANYREANDALGDKDFGMRIKISRKEAKETVYWLELLKQNNPELEPDISSLLDEASQLVKIFSTIIKRSSF